MKQKPKAENTYNYVKALTMLADQTGARIVDTELKFFDMRDPVATAGALEWGTVRALECKRVSVYRDPPGWRSRLRVIGESPVSVAAAVLQEAP
jgi:hypothetical protein